MDMKIIVKHICKHKLFCITLLATLLRFAFLDSFPSKLNVDEAAKGYNAYSLLQTGKTFRGLPWPLYFTDYDDSQPSTAIIYNYLVVPAVYFFGLTRFAVRLPAAILGIITIPLVYLLSYELFKDRRAALTTAVLLCISPWHVYLSRWGVEPISYPVFFLAGYLLLLKGVKKPPLTAVAGSMLGLCMYTYPSALVVVPAFIALFVGYKKLWNNASYLLVLFASLMITISPLIRLYLTDPLMYGHYNNLSVFTFLTKGSAVLVFVLQMLESVFLLIYLFPLLVVIYLVKGLLKAEKENSNRSIIYFLAILILVSLIPANLTLATDRITVMFIRGAVITGLVEMIVGKYIADHVFQNQNTKARVYIRAFLISTTFANSLLLLWIYTIIYSPANVYREIGYEEAYKYIKAVDDQYDNILVDVRENQPFIYLLFYYKYPPSVFQSQKAVRIKIEKHYTEYLKNFGKYYFCNLEDCPTLEGRSLVLTAPDRHENLKEIYSVTESGHKILTIKEML